MLNLDDAKLFKIRRGLDDKCFILRVDIYKRSLFIIVRRKGLIKYIEDISYGYL